MQGGQPAVRRDTRSESKQRRSRESTDVKAKSGRAQGNRMRESIKVGTEQKTEKDAAR